MSLVTYADLQNSIADQLARPDLTTQIVDFITLFEAFAARKLQVRPQETTATLTMTAGIGTLPSDYLTTRSVLWSGNPLNPLEYVHPTLFASYFPTQPSNPGIPFIYTVVGSTLKVMPINDTSPITLDYFAKNQALSASLNWLWTAFPDAYFCGALFEAYMFAKDMDNAVVWKGRRDEIFQEISTLNFRNAGPMAIRVSGVTP